MTILRARYRVFNWNNYKTPILFLHLLFLAAFLAKPALAQVTRDPLIVLTDKTESLDIARQIYSTNDPGRMLTDTIVAMRHQNNLKGVRALSDTIDLGLKSTRRWMTFTVRNASASENWILYFGDVTQGRLGFARFLSLTNFTTGETVPANALTPPWAGLHLKSGQDNLIVAAIEMEGPSPGLIKPQIVSETAFLAGQNALLRFDRIFILFLGALTACFALMAFLHRTRAYGLFALYEGALFLCLSLLKLQFLVSFGWQSGFVFMLLPVSLIAVLLGSRDMLGTLSRYDAENIMFLSLSVFALLCGLISVFLPFENSILDEILIFVPCAMIMALASGVCFLQGQQGAYGGYYLGLGWLIALAGFLLTGTALAGKYDPHFLALNGFWLGLFPQAVFFMLAADEKHRLETRDREQSMIRDHRAAHSQAKIQQSKEISDQARLLRVIERERELMVDLREREIQRTEEMRAAKERADAANRAKSMFLAVVSHEIRTPMTGIMGIIRLMQDTKLAPEQRDYILAIQKSGDTMLTLLNDILDFEKIQSGGMTLEIIDFDLPKLVQGVVTLMSGHAADKKITLASNIPEHFPRYLKGDPSRLRQVLLNLVNNALKFTSEGFVTIHLGARAAEDPGMKKTKGDFEVSFAVEDTGIGISEEAQQKLFSPFEQADVTIARKYGGTGLGLAISQRLIAVMGGSIHIKSQENKGSTFYFSLLMPQGDAESAEAIDQYRPLTIAKDGGLKLLIVEDNATNRKILQTFLEKQGHEIFTAETGQSALEICRTEHLDAVLSDINLAGSMSGLDLAKAVRLHSNPAIASLPIIAITGNVGDQDIRAIEEAGMNAFIRKPIPYDQLFALLADIKNGGLPARAFQDAPHQNQDQNQDRNQSLPAPAKQETGAWDAGDPLLDTVLLGGLMDSLGREQASALIQSCFDKASEILAALDKEAARSDLKTIKDRSHELKGMAANFGLKALSALAGKAESAAQQGQLEEAYAETRKFAATTDLSKRALQAWMQRIA